MAPDETASWPCEVLATALCGGPAVGAPGRGDGRREWRETRSSASTRPEVPRAACPLRLCLPGLPGILTGLGDVPAPVCCTDLQTVPPLSWK